MKIENLGTDPVTDVVIVATNWLADGERLALRAKNGPKRTLLPGQPWYPSTTSETAKTSGKPCSCCLKRRRANVKSRSPTWGYALASGRRAGAGP